MIDTCTTCRAVAARQWGRRVYADALVVVLLGRDDNGQRELRVLPRRHGPCNGDEALVREHSWAVARRAATALAEAGIPFAAGQGTWRLPGPPPEGQEGEPQHAAAHAILCVPEAPIREGSGVFRLPVEALADRDRLRPS